MTQQPESTAHFVARGKVTVDPLKDLPIGASFSIDPIDFGSSDATVQPQAVRNWGFFDGAILALGLKGQAGLDITGSAVMIAPGLALTAAHVLRDSLSQLGSGDQIPYCLGIRGDGRLDIWRTTNISYDDGDIAFLSLELNSAIGEGGRLRRVPVTTRMPAVGETLTICGLRIPEVLSGEVVSFAGEMLASRGIVQAVYEEGRDTVLVSFPAIEILCGSRGAMSGGAVFDASGHLIGIISAGMELESGDGPTYAAWIVPGLFRDVTIPWPPGVYPDPVRVAEAQLHLEGGQHLVHTEEGGVYESWSE